MLCVISLFVMMTIQEHDNSLSLQIAMSVFMIWANLAIIGTIRGVLKASRNVNANGASGEADGQAVQQGPTDSAGGAAGTDTPDNGPAASSTDSPEDPGPAAEASGTKALEAPKTYMDKVSSLGDKKLFGPGKPVPKNSSKVAPDREIEMSATRRIVN